MTQKHIGTTIAFDLWKKFVVLCRIKDIRISDFLKDSVKKFVESNAEELSKHGDKISK